MNAPANPAALMNQVIGELLYSGYQYDDGLMLDLYGSVEDGENLVEGVTVHGSKVDITVLFSGRKLQNMGLWLDCEGRPQMKQVQRQYGYEIGRLQA